MMKFCKEFNSKTAKFHTDVPLRIKLFAYSDRSYKYKIKSPPSSWFIKRVMGLEKCKAHRALKTGEVSLKHLYEISKIKR